MIKLGNPILLSNVESKPLIYMQNSPGIHISQTLLVSETGGDLIVGSTIQISGHYEFGQDRLDFPDTPDIFGSWDEAIGILTLSGVDTVVNYQTALRSVTYRNLSSQPNHLTRTIRFQTTNGFAISNICKRDIQVVLADHEFHVPHSAPAKHDPNSPLISPSLRRPIDDNGQSRSPVETPTDCFDHVHRPS